MYSPFKMKPKSPILKALVGKQNNLPAELKAKIEAAPESPAKMMKKSPAKGVKIKPKEGLDYTKSNSELNRKIGMGPRVKKSPAKMKKESSMKMKKESPAKLDGQAKKGKKGKKDTRTTSQKAAEKRDLDRQIRIYNAREKNRKYHAKREKRELKEKGYYIDVTDGKKYEHAEEMRGTGKNRKMTKFVREKK